MDRATPPWHALEEPPPGSATPDGEGRRTLAPAGRVADDPGPAAGRRQWLLAAAGVACAVLLAVAALVLARTETAEVTLTGVELGGGAASPTGQPSVAGGGGGTTQIVVDVGGAVARPGVYRLVAGSRVADAIAAAGGFGPRVDAAAAAGQLNLAALLADGERVRVPSRDDPPAASSAGGAAATPGGGLVDLNRATSAELEALPGIGPVTAAKIIAAREAAPFTTVDDLRTRKLVGQATFGRIRDLVTVGP